MIELDEQDKQSRNSVSDPNISLNPDRLCTRPLYRFLRDFDETVRFFLFTVHLAARADETRLIASKALHEGQGREHEEEYKKIIRNPAPVSEELRKFRYLQSQNLVLRVSNVFLLYYSEIIQAAILKRPEILKSKQTIRWDELLGFTRFDQVVRYLIDKKINELSYAGLDQMEEFMFERLGLQGAVTDDQRELAAILVEIRNIYTHNRGVVNGIFLGRVKNHMGFKFTEGKYFHVNFDHFMRLCANCLEVAYLIDEAVAKKFGLKRKRYKVWLTEANETPLKGLRQATA